MRTSEWIVVGYLACLFTCAIMRRMPAPRLRATSTAGGGVVFTIIFLAVLPQVPVVIGFRDWLPGIYLLTGYWLSGLFQNPPSHRLEEKLASFDRCIGLATAPGSISQRLPRFLLEYLEAAYLFVYALVPFALLVIFLLGEGGKADHFWTVVLIACYGSYSTLVLFTTRPPRATEKAGPSPVSRTLLLRKANLLVLDRGSIQVNTLPSGHAAGAMAAALIVAEVSPVAGAVFIWLALSVAAGSVIGRYHYAIDSILGLMLAIVAWLAA